MKKYGFEARCTGERDYLLTLANSYVDEWLAAFQRPEVRAGRVEATEDPAVAAWGTLLASRGCTLEYDVEEECFWLSGLPAGGDAPDEAGEASRVPLYY